MLQRLLFLISSQLSKCNSNSVNFTATQDSKYFTQIVRQVRWKSFSQHRPATYVGYSSSHFARYHLPVSTLGATARQQQLHKKQQPLLEKAIHSSIPIFQLQLVVPPRTLAFKQRSHSIDEAGSLNPLDLPSQSKGDSNRRQTRRKLSLPSLSSLSLLLILFGSYNFPLDKPISCEQSVRQFASSKLKTKFQKRISIRNWTNRLQRYLLQLLLGNFCSILSPKKSFKGVAHFIRKNSSKIKRRKPLIESGAMTNLFPGSSALSISLPHR